MLVTTLFAPIHLRRGLEGAKTKVETAVHTVVVWVVEEAGVIVNLGKGL